VERIEVCDLRDNTYYALIHLRGNQQCFPIDARPSDAIAIALRTNSPIYVKEEVLLKSQKTDDLPKQLVFSRDETDKWSEILEQLDPKDFSKYKM
jgi:hypothetical protein